jgi:hypothetical protein
MKKPPLQVVFSFGGAAGSPRLSPFNLLTLKKD